MKKNDFILEKIYPDTQKILNFKPKSIAEIKDDCIYVLDTNCLLEPYLISTGNFDKILEVYTKLKGENRLIIIDHTLREFFKNRQKKIMELSEAIRLKKNLSLNEDHTQKKYQFLELDETYIELTKIEIEIKEKIKSYKKKIDKILKKIENWNCNDPLTDKYREFFNEDVIFQNVLSKKERNELYHEFMIRAKHEIPPGFKDVEKTINKTGDLIIWKSIIKIGKTKQKNVIFVTNDSTKNDWFDSYKINKKNYIVNPRFELLLEFWAKTRKQHLQIIRFSDFIEINAESEKNLIDEIKNLEDEPELTVSTNLHKVFYTATPISKYPSAYSPSLFKVPGVSNYFDLNFSPFERHICENCGEYDICHFRNGQDLCDKCTDEVLTERFNPLLSICDSCGKRAYCNNLGGKNLCDDCSHYVNIP